MYLEFFGLSEQPFSISPNTHFLYESHSHEVAMSTLKYGINDRMGFLLLTGEVGTGKTTIVRALLEQINKEVHTALIINPLLSVPELLRAITKDFGIRTRINTPQRQIEALNKFLLKINENGENALLIIDEAQNLSEEALEAIRLLTNLETHQHKLLQILLVGQPELNRKLEERKLRQLAQRITTKAHLEALDINDTMRYINHRIRIANGGGKVFFEPKACRVIHKETRGYPRLVNLLCHLALTSAYVRGTQMVDSESVFHAVAEWRGMKKPSIWSRFKRWLFS
jgi:general secretion pathway protein A